MRSLLTRAWPWAVLTFVLANLWIWSRLPVLLQDTEYGEMVTLDRRAADFPAEKVEILVVGNSHAMAGLRPAAVEAAWGLPVGSVFNVALPGASAIEVQLLVERYLPRFPRVRLVLCGIDAYFLKSGNVSRVQRLTAGRPLARLDATETYSSAVRMRTVVAAGFPILDFGPDLHAAFVEHSWHSAKALVRQVPPLSPQMIQLAAYPEPAGYPFRYDVYDWRRLTEMKQAERKPANLARRIEQVSFDPEMTRFSLARLARLATDIRPARFALVEMPFAPVVERALARRHPGQGREWRALLAADPVLASVPLTPLPTLAEDDFYDGNHMIPVGSRAMARHVAAYLAPDGTPRLPRVTGDPAGNTR